MIIGMVGFIGAGKGATADILVNKYGFDRESFANGVKNAVSNVFGWDRELLEGATAESRKWREEPDDFWSGKFGKTFTPRMALQLMGTEAGRNVFHEDLWVMAMERRMSSEKSYVISDVRFPNEVEAIKRMGGKVIRVQRGNLPEWYDFAVRTNELNNWSGQVQHMIKYPDVHYSEWAWCGIPLDYEPIMNDGTLQDLENKVELLLKNV